MASHGHSAAGASAHGAAGAPPGAPPGATGPPGSMGPLTAPYPPMYAALGGVPAYWPDIPITATFMALFIIVGFAHMGRFQRNRWAQHKFVFSAAMFAFCMIRLISTALRISWAKDQYNVKLGIAAQIFVQAGTVILFIINLFFAQRLMRSRHPHIGWSKSFTALIPPFCIFLVITGLIMIITVIVQQFYTLDPHTHHIDRAITLYVVTLMAVLAFMPVVIVAIMLAIPRRTYIDRFGAGHFRSKVALIVFSSVILTLGASFRAAITWMPPIPLPGTAWYYSKECFYLFDFTIEFIVVFAYLVIRADKRFYVEDGCKEPGSYSGDVVREKDNILWPQSVYQSQDDLAADAEYSDGESEKGFPAVLELDSKSGGWRVRRLSEVSAETMMKMRS